VGLQITDHDASIPYCPKCNAKHFSLTDTDTVCARCRELFTGDEVTTWREMKKGEYPATVKRTDGSTVEIPDEVIGASGTQLRKHTGILSPAPGSRLRPCSLSKCRKTRLSGGWFVRPRERW
jgi:hypothetical protein